GMSQRRYAERRRLFEQLQTEHARRISGAARDELREAVDAAHRLMASPAARAFDLGLEPGPACDAYNTGRFGLGCLVARALIQAGSRFVEVSFEFEPFGHWDTHENGHTRVEEMKRQMDAPHARMVRALDVLGRL